MSLVISSYSTRRFNGFVSSEIKLPNDLMSTPCIIELQALNEDLVTARARRKATEDKTGRKMKPLGWRGALPALAEILTLTMVENIGNKKCLSVGDLSRMANEWGFADLINPKNEPYVFKNVVKKIRDNSQRQLSHDVLEILRQHKVIAESFHSGGMPRIGYRLVQK